VASILTTLLEDETFDVQEEAGQNNSFSHGTGHDPILELAEEEEGKLLTPFCV
jgi:hypothetical protein